MSRLTKQDAQEIATRFGIDLSRDFHTLSASEVESVLDAADLHKYRKPANANGSRARYFHAYLRRLLDRE